VWKKYSLDTLVLSWFFLQREGGANMIVCKQLILSDQKIPDHLHTSSEQPCWVSHSNEHNFEDAILGSSDNTPPYASILLGWSKSGCKTKCPWWKKRIVNIEFSDDIVSRLRLRGHWLWGLDQTVLCIPCLDSVLELGTTSLVSHVLHNAPASFNQSLWLATVELERQDHSCQ
jgi:hypothetical protein